MKTVEILVGHTGYPNGKDKRHFAEGEEAELPNDYADMIIGKSLAREKPAAPATPKGKGHDSGWIEPATSKAAPAKAKDDK